MLMSISKRAFELIRCGSISGSGSGLEQLRMLRTFATFGNGNANPKFSWSRNPRFLYSRSISTNGQNVRFKKSTPSTTTTTTKDSDEPYDEILGRGDKVLKVRLTTTRLDGILKIGLQISKNKIEKHFYEDRIRINGDRPRKKSQQLMEGDEIDIVRGRNKMNEDFLDVSRVEIVKLGEESNTKADDSYDSDDEESDYKIPAILKRYKSLTIENYPTQWKGPVSDT